MKLDWIPLYINRIKGSARYRAMKDYQQGWYFNLLIESVDSEMPGYLPNDGQLWRLANAASERFFNQESAPVLACFKRRQHDGRVWIYNERLLQTYEEQIHKLTKNSTGKKIKIPLISSLDTGLLLLIYQDYPRHEAKTKALTAIKKAISKYAFENSLDCLAATKYIHEAVIEFAKSHAGKADGMFPGYRPPHPATWFNGERYMDDRKEWHSTNGETTLFDPGKYRPTEAKIYCYACQMPFDLSVREGIFCSNSCEEKYEARKLRAQAERVSK